MKSIIKKHVIIIGGGVAGMSAAHELIERGFRVTVFEKQPILPGGKARSIPIEKTVEGNNKPLPGEHGFRFFPGFYKHMFHTLKRIPFYNENTKRFNKNGVFDNLVECPEIMLARKGNKNIRVPSHFPRSIKEFKKLIRTVKELNIGLEPGEAEVIVEKIWQLFTSCQERMENEYEAIGWRQFAEADKHSPSYDEVFVDGLTGALVAGKSSVANTQTNGKILKQMLLGIMKPGSISDRVLNAPTNEAWLHPWYNYLTSKGVAYHFNSVAEKFESDKEKITGVLIRNSKGVCKHTADYYLCALPVERAAELVNNQDILQLDPKLKNIIQLKDTVAWMNGIQFFLKEDVSINQGHIILPDTPWALTAISQPQFWAGVDLSNYGSGKIKGILSIIISNWKKNGRVRHLKPAENCTLIEVVEEAWAQLKECLNNDGILLTDYEGFYIADSIRFKNESFIDSPELYAPSRFGSNEVLKNDEPLLINEVNTWSRRSETFTAIPNFFLASDYVKTNTNLATMEGANEAARRAVNNIINASGMNVPYCKIWSLKEPLWFNWYKWLDQRRYRKGLPWKLHKPWFTGIIKFILRLLKIKL